MLLESLGYVIVGAADVPGWAELATRLLGLQVGERSATTLALRMDERPQRLIVTSDKAQPPYTLGWEVSSSRALDALASRLDGAGVAVTHESNSTAARRAVREVISFCDPAGNRLEAFFGHCTDARKFEPARPISGFRTGALGLGHAVLTVEHVEAVRPFYAELLQFRLSDYTVAPFKAFFFHINERHHSLALIETGRNGLHHLMLEVLSLDDVGQAYDIAQTERGRVGVTLGRHSNDFMTSFYARTPSPFLIEYGWGGRNVAPGEWPAEEYTCGPSLWGHERGWLSAQKRAEALELRLKAAAIGLRAPVQVLDGYYTRVR